MDEREIQKRKRIQVKCVFIKINLLSVIVIIITNVFIKSFAVLYRSPDKNPISFNPEKLSGKN